MKDERKREARKHKDGDKRTKKTKEKRERKDTETKKK